MTEPCFVRISLDGDFSIAGYHVMARWPQSVNGPQLGATKPLELIFDCSDPVMLATLREIFASLPPDRALLHRSCEAWRTAFVKCGFDLPPPPPASNSAAAGAGPGARAG